MFLHFSSSSRILPFLSSNSCIAVLKISLSICPVAYLNFVSFICFSTSVSLFESNVSESFTSLLPSFNNCLTTFSTIADITVGTLYPLSMTTYCSCSVKAETLL